MRNAPTRNTSPNRVDSTPPAARAQSTAAAPSARTAEDAQARPAAADRAEKKTPQEVTPFPTSDEIAGEVVPWLPGRVSCWLSTSVAQIMTPVVCVCSVKDVLSTAAKALWERDCGSLPVVDESRRVVGMITDRDICMAALWQGKPLQEITVGSAMARVVHCCTTADSVREVEEIMRQARIRRIPVTDADGRLAGIVSVNDLVRQAARELDLECREASLAEVAKTIATVGAPRAVLTVEIN